MTFSRKSALTGSLGAFASVCIPRHPTGAAEFNYKFGVTVAAEEPMATCALQAAARIYHESNGRLDIRVYPNSVLGGDVAMLDQVRLGALEFFSTGHLTLANLAPVAGIDNLPFIFSSYDQAWTACEGALGKYIQIALAKAGVYQFAKYWEGNFNNTFNNVRPIVTPADLKGLRIRIQPGPVLVALLKGFGATPVSMSFDSVYTSLQTHLIDGAVTGSSFVESSKLYEVLKYASTTNHVFSPVATVANPGAMQRLPKNLRDMLENHFYVAAIEARRDSHRLDSEGLDKLKARGMLVNKVDLAPFRAEVRKLGLYNQWKMAYGDEAWAVLEKAVGPLT